MTVSGVSLLASKLSDRRTATRESVQLSEAESSLFSIPKSKDEWIEELHYLSDQSSQQERALVVYHEHLSMANRLIGHLKFQLLSNVVSHYRFRMKMDAFSKLRRLLNETSRRPPVKQPAQVPIGLTPLNSDTPHKLTHSSRKAILNSTSGFMTDSVNLNETLKHLVDQLQSPSKLSAFNDSQLSLASSIAVAPFTICRSRQRR